MPVDSFAIFLCHPIIDGIILSGGSIVLKRYSIIDIVVYAMLLIPFTRRSAGITQATIPRYQPISLSIIIPDE